MKINKVTIYQSGLDSTKFRISNIVVLRIDTDAGIYGLGEIALAYGSGSQAGTYMIKEFAESFLIGNNPFEIEKIWDTIYRQTFWAQANGGPIVYGAMSAIDEALWDIKGKALNVPVYELLGGKFSDKIRVYGNGWYAKAIKPEEYGDAAKQAVEINNVTALKFDPFMITDKGDFSYPPRECEMKRMRLARDRIKSVREAVGEDVDILVEIHGNLGTNSAITFGRMIEEFKPMFYEEPVDSSNVKAMKKVSDSVRIPIAAGERLYTRYQFKDFIEQQALDIIQPDIGLAGGLTECKKIASYAETYHIHFQPHNCGGPVSTAVALQLDFACSNFVIQECFPYFKDNRYEMVKEDYEHKIIDGYINAPVKAGLGIEMNESYFKNCDKIEVK